MINENKPPENIGEHQIQSVGEYLIRSRRSIRAFLPKEVPQNVLEDILNLAAKAPSGTNTQPWNVLVVRGDRLKKISELLLAAHKDQVDQSTPKDKYQEPYDYYPKKWVEPYLGRRRQVGWDLYSLMEIPKGDFAKTHAQHARNYHFFDAPVLLLFTIDKVMGQGSWLDYGMFLQNIMVAARVYGLDTCAQAAHNPFHQIIKQELSIPDDEELVCGMALGYADIEAKINQLKTFRAEAKEFCRYFD